MNFCSITCISPHRKRPTYAPYDSKDCELIVQPCDVVCRRGVKPLIELTLLD